MSNREREGVPQEAALDGDLREREVEVFGAEILREITDKKGKKEENPQMVIYKYLTLEKYEEILSDFSSTSFNFYPLRLIDTVAKREEAEKLFESIARWYAAYKKGKKEQLERTGTDLQAIMKFKKKELDSLQKIVSAISDITTPA